MGFHGDAAIRYPRQLRSDVVLAEVVRLDVDGKPREDGVRDFLASRDITLPEGHPDDPPAAQTVYGLGNRKNILVLRKIREDGVEAYPGSVRYVEAVKAAGPRRLAAR